MPDMKRSTLVLAGFLASLTLACGKSTLPSGISDGAAAGDGGTNGDGARGDGQGKGGAGGSGSGGSSGQGGGTGSGGDGGGSGTGGAGGGEPAPGTSPIGGPCVLPGDCVGAPDGFDGPICYTDGTGFPGGYCTMFRCSLDAQNCPGSDAVCVNFGGGGMGGPRTGCLSKCTSSSDCRPGYHCATIGGTQACWYGCTGDSECPDGQKCTFGDGAMVGACKTADAKATGEACKSATECRGAYCISEKDYGWPKGYCSSTGMGDGGDCDGGAGTCVGGGGGGTCMRKCDADADCRPGYECVVRGRDRTQHWCEPNCTLDSQCDNMSCHAGTGYC